MTERKAKELRVDVAVVGGGVGGVAAALAAARAGRTVALSEETDWIGGQLTQQAVPPDENPWIEQFGCTRSYRQFRNGVREYYRRAYPLSSDALKAWNLNPGDGSVSRLCHEPRVALAALLEMLQPYLSCGLIHLLLRHRPVAAETDGDTVRSVLLRDLDTGNALAVHARYFLDATELGDVLPLAGVEYVVGAESRDETGELHAAEKPDPANQQAFTCCFAMDHVPGEDHTIDRPAEYAFWREYAPTLTPEWCGRLLSLRTCDPITLQARENVFDPIEEAAGRAWGFWRYRRILSAANLAPGAAGQDICLVNWPMNDYWLGGLIDVPEAEAAAHVARAKQLSLSLLYWLQTEAPRADGGTGWPGLRLRPDVVGTEDGLAKHPYIRESRRIRAQFTVLEQHVGVEARRAATGLPLEELRSERFDDSVGIGYYRIDLHPSTGGDNYIDIGSLPFQIPLGALIPVRVANLLPACKNLGVTHVTNGCYRLHPVEWNIGEAAGALAAFCLEVGEPPAGVRSSARLRDFQTRLRDCGVETDWPRLWPI